MTPEESTATISSTTTSSSRKHPKRRVGSTRTIAVTNMLISLILIIYHIWEFVSVSIHPDKLHNTGQTDVVVYTGMVIMILSSIVQFIICWSLFKRVGWLRINPASVLSTCQCWRRWNGCFLTFYIVSLLILVLSAGKQVQQGVLQNYMAGLLILSTFTIYGLYYVGKFCDEMKTHYNLQSPDNNATSTSNNTTNIYHPNTTTSGSSTTLVLGQDLSMTTRNDNPSYHLSSSSPNVSFVGSR